MRGDTLGLLSADFVVAETLFTPGGSRIPIAKQDPTRWALLFGLPTTVAAAVFSTVPAGGASSGFTLNAQFPIFGFNFRDYGALVTLPWFCFQAAGGTVSITEVFYRPVGLLTTNEIDLEELSDRLEHLENA